MTSLLHRHRDFRLLWLGETTGKFGTSVTSVALPLVAVATLDAGTFEVGLLTACSWLPWLLIGLPAGVWVDRHRRRPVMMVSAAASLVLFASIPAVTQAGGLSIGFLLAVALLTGTAAVFFQTAYTAYLPSLLEPADQAEGNSKLHGSASAAQIAGKGTGGLIVETAGAANAMLADAATFLVSLVCLSAIKHREPPPPKKTAHKPLPHEIKEGLRLVAHDQWIRTLTVFGAASNLALMGYQSILVVFLVREVGLSAGTVGLLIAVASTGGVAGAFAARRVAARTGTARATLLFELVLAVPALLIPLTVDGTGTVLYVVGSFCITAGVVAGNVIKAGFNQSYCPPRLLGRLSASTSFLNYGTLPVGALLGGALGSTLGLREAMWITTAGVPLAGLVLLFSPLRTVRDLPKHQWSGPGTELSPVPDSSPKAPQLPPRAAASSHHRPPQAEPPQDPPGADSRR